MSNKNWCPNVDRKHLIISFYKSLCLDICQTAGQRMFDFSSDFTAMQIIRRIRAYNQAVTIYHKIFSPLLSLWIHFIQTNLIQEWILDLSNKAKEFTILLSNSIWISMQCINSYLPAIEVYGEEFCWENKKLFIKNDDTKKLEYVFQVCILIYLYTYIRIRSTKNLLDICIDIVSIVYPPLPPSSHTHHSQ